MADVDALFPNRPGQHRLAAVNVSPLRLVGGERLGPLPKVNPFEFGVDEQLADRLFSVREAAQLQECLLVALRQVGIRFLQFSEVQGTDRVERVVRLQGRVPKGHQLVELIEDGAGRVPPTVLALPGLWGIVGVLAKEFLPAFEFDEPAAT